MFDEQILSWPARNGMGSRRVTRVLRYTLVAEIQCGGTSDCTRRRAWCACVQPGRLRPSFALSSAKMSDIDVEIQRKPNVASPQKSTRISPCRSTVLFVCKRNFSTFSSPKIAQLKMKNLLYSRACGGIPPQPVRKVMQGKRAPKKSANFSGHFDRKSLANHMKTIKKTIQNNAKKCVILTRICRDQFLKISTRMRRKAPSGMALCNPPQLPKTLSLGVVAIRS
jgi:hypothetical protein